MTKPEKKVYRARISHQDKRGSGDKFVSPRRVTSWFLWEANPFLAGNAFVVDMENRETVKC